MGLNTHGSFPHYLESWEVDRLAVHRIVIARRWVERPDSTIDPSVLPVSGIPFVRFHVTPEDGGGHGISRWYFEGAPPQSSLTEAVYGFEFEGTFSQEPITSHPRWQALKERYGGRLEGGEVKFPETLPQELQGKGLSKVKLKTGEEKNPLYGVETYLSLGAVWSVTRAYRTIPDNLLEGVGCVVKNPPGNPPTPEGRNWLKMAPTGRRRGNVAEITHRYMLSGIGGWVEDIYSENGVAINDGTGVQSIKDMLEAGLQNRLPNIL